MNAKLIGNERCFHHFTGVHATQTVCNNGCYCFCDITSTNISSEDFTTETLNVFCHGSKNVNQGASRTRTLMFCILLITFCKCLQVFPFNTAHTLFSAAQCSPGFDSSPPLSSQDPLLSITSH